MTSMVTISHIELDAEGRAWIAGANTKVSEIVLGKLAWGWNPKRCACNTPHLSLAQIHAPLSYYYDHQDELQAEIAEQMREYEELRAQAENPLLRQKLRALGKLQ